MSESHVRGLYELIQVLLGLVIRKAIKNVREEDLDPIIALIHELQVAASDRDVDRFFDLSFQFLEHAYPFARNAFVEEVLTDLHPALQRTYFMALHLDGDEMKECLSFYKALVETKIASKYKLNFFPLLIPVKTKISSSFSTLSKAF